MIEVKLIIKPLKPKQDRSTGAPIEEISGLPIFPEGVKAEDAFRHHNKAGVFLLAEEYKELTNGGFDVNKEAAVAMFRSYVDHFILYLAKQEQPEENFDFGAVQDQP